MKCNFDSLYYSNEKWLLKIYFLTLTAKVSKLAGIHMNSNERYLTSVQNALHLVECIGQKFWVFSMLENKILSILVHRAPICRHFKKITCCLNTLYIKYSNKIFWLIGQNHLANICTVD